MDSKSQEILRYIQEHHWIPLEDLLAKFGNNYETESCIYVLKSSGKLLYKLENESVGERYAISPYGRKRLEEIEKQAALEKENVRLNQQISNSLEELKELRKIAESSKEQADRAITESKSSNITAWVGVALSVLNLAWAIIQFFL